LRNFDVSRKHINYLKYWLFISNSVLIICLSIYNRTMKWIILMTIICLNVRNLCFDNCKHWLSTWFNKETNLERINFVWIHDLKFDELSTFKSWNFVDKQEK
jgi:hypothetical protein